MAKNSIRDYSNVNSSNTDIQSIDIAEGCSPAGINNAIREVMADLKDVSTGTVALESPAADSLTVTGDLTVDTDRLIVDSTNNRVGIGTTSADAGLNIKQTADDAYQLKLEQYNATDGYGIICDMTDGALAFARYASSAYSERMRITAAGNVGIGTTSPNYLTEIAGNGGGDTVTLALTNAGSDPARLRLNSGHGNWSVGNSITVADALEFRDESASSTRMLIDSGGGVLINTASAVGAGGPRLSMAFNGSTTWLANTNDTNGTSGARHFTFHSSGSEVGRITTTTSATTYTTTSDYRLKENVVADWDATTRLKQLNPVRFNFIADPDTTVDGFLAHEVQDIVPEAISGEKDAMRDEEYEVTPAVLDEDGNEITPAVMGTRSVPDYQGIDQSKLVPLLVKTIQELEARITALENA